MLKSPMNKTVFLGFVALLTWCIFSALGKIFIFDENLVLHPAVLAFYIFSMTFLFFALLNGQNNPILFRKFSQHWQPVLGLNLATLGSWGCVIFALQYLEPSLVDVIALGFSPVATLVFSMLFLNKKSGNRQDYVISIALFLLVCYVVWMCMMGETALIKPVALSHTGLGLFLCFVAGSSVSGIILFTKRLYERNFSPYEVIISRYILLILLSGTLLLFQHQTLLLSSAQYGNLLLLALIILIIPVYLMQISIRALHPITVSIMMPLLPVFTFCFESFSHYFYWSVYSLVAVVGLFALTALGAYWRYQAEMA